MPFSELPEPLPKNGTYYVAGSFDGISFSSAGFGTEIYPGMPTGMEYDWDELDAKIQEIVDRLSEVSGMVVTAVKSRAAQQNVTPTEESA